jgi:AraC-like DNA-binding protein
VAAIPPVVLRPAEPVERPFRYARRSPGAALDVARSYWSVEWSLPAGLHHDQDVVTHPSVHVTVESGRAWIQGIVTKRFTRRLVGSGRVVGVQLVPTGLSSMTSTPPALVTGRRVPAEELLGDVGGLIAAVDAAPDQASGMLSFEEWLVARNPRRAAAAVVVDDAVALIAEDRSLTRVDDVARALHVTVRTLQRRFDRYLGIGPKWVVRRCRIQDALAIIEAGGDVDWSDLARRLGFTDQAHFVSSFTAVVGVPPGRYAKRPELS